MRTVRRSSILAAFVVIAALAAPSLLAQLVEPPLPPTLTGEAAGSRVSLAWTPNASGPTATGFQLEAGTGPGLANIAIVQLPGGQRSFAADAPAGTYFIRIRGINQTLLGAPSNEIVIFVGGGPCLPPSPPTGLTATPSPTGVTLQWIAPASGSPVTGYRLDAGSAPGATNIGSFALPATTTLTSPAPPGQYFVRLTALNACGSSAPSAEISFTVGGSFNPALLVGSWTGTMSGNQRPGLGRPPISSFTLRIDAAPPVSLTRIGGRWADNAGCVNTNVFGGRNAQGLYIVDIEALTCNDGDLLLTFTSITANQADGRCNGGPNCTFRMTK